MPDMGTPAGDANYKENEPIYLQYNEYIVYEAAQVRLRYLLRTEILQKRD